MSIFSLDPEDLDFLSEQPKLDLFQYSGHLAFVPSDDIHDDIEPPDFTIPSSDNFLGYSDLPPSSPPSTTMEDYDSLKFSDIFTPTTALASNHTLPQPNRIDTPKELWYNGEVLLVIFQAEGQDFLVPHKTLSLKSPVFNDFMSSSNSVSVLFEHGAADEVTGPPRIKFLGVSSQEATYFFQALYDAEFFEGPPRRFALDVILAVFKLSSMYGVDFLRQRALAHLDLAYPCGGIEEWDERFEAGATTFPIERAENVGEASHTLAKTLEIIDLCSTYNAEWILPTAIYEACLYDLDSLLGHYKWQDGSLTDDIKNTILSGYSVHTKENYQILSFLHQGKMDSCANPPLCHQYRLEMSERIDEIFSEDQDSNSTTSSSDPLAWPMQDFLGDVWTDKDWAEMSDNPTCDPCLRVCQGRHAYNRREAWERLPGIYGLESWDTLRAAKRKSRTGTLTGSLHSALI